MATDQLKGLARAQEIYRYRSRRARELKQAGKTCLVVHHDLQTVPAYFDYVVLLNMRVVAHGPTDEVFTDDNLKKTYGGKLTLLSDAVYAYSKDPRLPAGRGGEDARRQSRSPDAPSHKVARRGVLRRGEDRLGSAAGV